MAGNAYGYHSLRFLIASKTFNDSYWLLTYDIKHTDENSQDNQENRNPSKEKCAMLVLKIRSIKKFLCFIIAQPYNFSRKMSDKLTDRGKEKRRKWHFLNLLCLALLILETLVNRRLVRNREAFDMKKTETIAFQPLRNLNKICVWRIRFELHLKLRYQKLIYDTS